MPVWAAPAPGFEKSNNVVTQRALVAFQRQDIAIALIEDLLGDLALAVERVVQEGT